MSYFTQGMRLKSWLIFFLIFISFQAFSLTQIQTGQPFKYTLQLADVHCWLSKKCRGSLKEGPRAEMGKSLQSFLQDLSLQDDKGEILFALYGVRNQSWFLEGIKKLSEKGHSLKFMLDQKDDLPGGLLNPRNLPYSSGPGIVRILGEERVRADVNLDLSPRKSRLMHNKFAVFNSRWTWVSTANISETELGDEYHANASLFIDSTHLAAIYKSEFEEMFNERRNGIHKDDRLEAQELLYTDGTRVRVGFSPKDLVIEQLILPALDKARSEVFLAQFFLTDISVMRKLIHIHRKGVKVRLLLDAVAARHPSSVHLKLREAGIKVRVERLGGKMHLKLALIDKKSVLIGSMNWTKSGNLGNDENTLLIENKPDLVLNLREYLESLWSAFSMHETRDPLAESWESVNSCTDQIDNDHDGLIDEEEQSCQ